MLKQVVLLVAVIGLLQSAAAKNLPGAFEAPALAFYFVHKGGPLKLDFSARVSQKQNAGQVLCRFFDADEKLVKWQYTKISKDSTWKQSHNYGKNAPKGVYQIRCSSKNAMVSVKSTPEEGFGVMAARCMFHSGIKGQFDNAYFYVLPGTKKIILQGFGISGTVFDSTGKAIKKLVTHKRNEINLTGQSGKVCSLKLNMPVGSYYRTQISGMPTILCGDKATAAAIAGSVNKAPDGKYYPHKFQVEMVKYLQSLKKSDLELAPIDLTTREKEWLADPNAAALLDGHGAMKHFPHIMSIQQTDPKAKDFGACKSRYVMAFVLGLNRPFNPYYKNKTLQKKVLASAFRYLLGMTEYETFQSAGNNYCGGDALLGVEDVTGFGAGANAIEDKKLRDLWIDGMRRLPDRFPFFRVSCENQSSHWPYIYYWTCKGTGEKGYLNLAQDYIKSMSLPENNPFMKTGYQQEAYGPDATYQGLGACYQAAYYRMSGDENAKAGLKRIYNLFNHTTAPEPDGKKKYGASMFSHRTAGSWTTPQYGAGRPLMRGELEEAAIWNRQTKTYSPEEIKKLIRQKVPEYVYKNSPQVMKYAAGVWNSMFSDYFYRSENLKNSVHPVLKSDNFLKNFNNEFICVRRPSYYAFAYIGKTAAGWTKSRVNFKPYNKKPVYKWNQTQGLGMFWTPDFGNNLLAMNWTADTANIIRADISDDKCDLPSYWSLSSNFDPDTMTLLMNWKMLKTPVDIQRKITFGETSIKVKVRLRFTGDVKIRDMFEQLPFVKKSGVTIEFDNAGKWQDKPCKTAAVRFRNSAGAGVLYKFKKPHDMSFGPESKATWDKSQVNGVIRIHLGGVFKKNKLARVQYVIIPVKP